MLLDTFRPLINIDICKPNFNFENTLSSKAKYTTISQNRAFFTINSRHSKRKLMICTQTPNSSTIIELVTKSTAKHDITKLAFLFDSNLIFFKEKKRNLQLKIFQWITL